MENAKDSWGMILYLQRCERDPSLISSGLLLPQIDSILAVVCFKYVDTGSIMTSRRHAVSVHGGSGSVRTSSSNAKVSLQEVRYFGRSWRHDAPADPSRSSRTGTQHQKVSVFEQFALTGPLKI